MLSYLPVDKPNANQGNQNKYGQSNEKWSNSYIPCQEYTPKTNGRVNPAFVPDSSISHTNEPHTPTFQTIPISNEQIPELEIPPMETDVPENWVKIEGKFILLLAVYLPYIAGDMLAAPDSRTNDRVIYLQYIKAGAPKSALLKILMDFETGNHVNSPYVQIVKVYGFRLVPDTSSRGNIMVDGEKVPVGPIQGCLSPTQSNVLSIL